MNRIVFALPNGLTMQQGGKKVVSKISNDGKKVLNSFKEENRIIFHNFPFLRGIECFFCGIFAFFCNLLSCEEQKSLKPKSEKEREKRKNVEAKPGKRKNEKRQNKNRYVQKRGQNWLFFAFFLIFAVVFAIFGLGMLPAKLGYFFLDFRGSEFLRNFVIMLFRVAMFVVFLSFFRIFPTFCEFLRFNRAGDVALLLGEKIKKQKCAARPLNFLNYIVFVFVLDFVVISLIGANFGFLYNFLFHVAMLFACISLGYEILWVLEKVAFLRNLAWITAFLVYSKPTTTHLETAYVAMTELSLLQSQKDREFMNGENHAFAVVYGEVRERLISAGINDKSDADWLIATILGKNRAEIKLVSSVNEKQYQDIMKATARRAKGESLDNIFGYTEFFGLRFDVNKKVLTPRMETEILVENVLKIAKNMAQNRKKVEILDLGTGSGAIAVALAKNCDAHITAVDVSKNALAVAENNAKKNDVKIEFLHSNLFEGLKRKRKFDIIVSNPPYIKSGDIGKLDKNVRECDPVLALDGGEDGLDFYRAIVPAAIKHLTSGGMLFFEIGKGQAAAVRKLMRENGFEEIKTLKDYNKIDRIVCGKV